jgi:tRNA modification GTPase
MSARADALTQSLPGATDTIAAQATPPGRGALSVIRVSGPRAHAIGRAVATRWPEHPRVATLANLLDGSGAVLDEAVVVRYDAPHSFTGEDAVEISTHGGVVVPATVLATLIERGARLATAGEFTRRAVLNGKVDILQAEAIADLIGAASRAAQRVALHQLDGGLSRRITALRSDVLGVEALIAYDIDFPEEDDGPVAPARTLLVLDQLEGALRALLATAHAGELVREGAVVVLCGAPNVGKSSLFNALLGRNRAIVTEIPGTTRDAIEAVVDVDPWPLRLVDTAGLRETDDPVERLGIEVSERYLRQAAAVLVCGDDAPSLRAAARAARAVLATEGDDRIPILLVYTKADLDGRMSGEELASLQVECRSASAVRVSAETGEGMQQLLETLGRVLGEAVGVPELDAPLLTQTRHRQGVERALQEVAAFRRTWQDEALPATIAAVHLRTAAGALEEIIGRVDIDDVLDEVFSRFCIGK